MRKHRYVEILADWARDVGYATIHTLIRNCLDFMDQEAQVMLPKLNPNILYYLPSLFQYVVAKTKEPKVNEQPNLSLVETSNMKQFYLYYS